MAIHAKIIVVALTLLNVTTSVHGGCRTEGTPVRILSENCLAVANYIHDTYAPNAPDCTLAIFSTGSNPPCFGPPASSAWPQQDRNCDDVGCGEICEGDGECGTSNTHNTCNIWELYINKCEELAVTLAAEPSTCSGTGSYADGSVTATVTGGGAPFTYAWSNGATTANLAGVPGGTYSVTVTDVTGAEVISASVTVDEPTGKGKSNQCSTAAKSSMSMSSCRQECEAECSSASSSGSSSGSSSSGRRDRRSLNVANLPASASTGSIVAIAVAMNVAVIGVAAMIAKRKLASHAECQPPVANVAVDSI